MAPEKRTIRFNMLFSPDEMSMLRCVGDAMGLTSSDTIRLLVRNAFREQARDSGVKPDELLEDLRHMPGVDREGTFQGATLDEADANQERTRAARKAAAASRAATVSIPRKKK